MRSSAKQRCSKETNIRLNLNIDGSGNHKIKTPVNFLNHLLEAFSKHGIFDLDLEAEGDTHIDQHHTVEDVGMTLGQAFKEALGDKKGINRAGFFAFPMDDALGVVAVDFGGRPFTVFKAKFRRRRVGDLETDTIKEFFSGFSMGAACNISVNSTSGSNDHHKAESIFKAFGKSVMMACSKEKRLKEFLPTTKGIID